MTHPSSKSTRGKREEKHLILDQSLQESKKKKRVRDAKKNNKPNIDGDPLPQPKKSLEKSKKIKSNGDIKEKYSPKEDDPDSLSNGSLEKSRKRKKHQDTEEKEARNKGNRHLSSQKSKNEEQTRFAKENETPSKDDQHHQPHPNGSSQKSKKRKRSRDNQATKTPNNNDPPTHQHVTENAPETLQLEAAENKKKKRRNRGKKSSNIPKPGEEGYLTKTQRKRAQRKRAKEKKKLDLRPKPTIDPSLQYISKPLSCPLVRKARLYLAQLKIPFRIFLGKLHGWRTVSKLPVRAITNDDRKTCAIGLFQPKSHNILQVPDCPVHHPSINTTISHLQQICNQLNIAPYDEAEGIGFLRYVGINVERHTGNVQLTLIWNSSPYEGNANESVEKDNDATGREQIRALVEAILAKKEKIGLHSLWIHFNAQWKHADNVFDFSTSASCHSLWKLMYGPKHIVETLDMSACKHPNKADQIKLHFAPNVFRQANLDAFTKIVVAIRNYIIKYNTSRRNGNRHDETQSLPSCLELYGGVGTIGLHICDLTSSFLSSDENPFNHDCFMKSVVGFTTETRNKVTYESKNAIAVLQHRVYNRRESFEIVIADPPRKGLEEFVMQSLTSSEMHETKLFIYISCGFDAFQRDSNRLLQSGRWTLHYAEGHLLFPGSDAIEILAFFESTKSI